VGEDEFKKLLVKVQRQITPSRCAKANRHEQPQARSALKTGISIKKPHKTEIYHPVLINTMRAQRVHERPKDETKPKNRNQKQIKKRKIPCRFKGEFLVFGNLKIQVYQKKGLGGK
jgi:hypothetical protein